MVSPIPSGVQNGILETSDVPTVATTDSMQGKESKLVIYDWGISQTEKFSDMGFTTDDHRGTVGLTRMKEAMCKDSRQPFADKKPLLVLNVWLFFECHRLQKLRRQRHGFDADISEWVLFTNVEERTFVEDLLVHSYIGTRLSVPHMIQA